MFVYSSRSTIWSTCLILVLAVAASAQTPETVVATVNSIEITQKQVDDSVAAQIYPLQQQLYAIRKAALENLITTKILASEAAARRISIDDLRKQLTLWGGERHARAGRRRLQTERVVLRNNEP